MEKRRCYHVTQVRASVTGNLVYPKHLVDDGATVTGR